MIAFCPIELDYVEVNENLINSLIDKYNPGHHDKIWETLPLVGRVLSQKDFLDAKKFEVAWEKRYDENGIILHNENVKTELKPIFDQFLKLPMLVTHAQILRAVKDVPKHHDMKHKNGSFINDLPNDSYEPNGWKILLNKVNEKSFYVCKDWNSEPNYVKLPNDTNTFVINEKTFPHGSTYTTKKCIVSIFGLVNKKNADELILNSSKKYKDYLIEF